MAWVTTTIVCPLLRQVGHDGEDLAVMRGSSALVGSSNRMASGSMARARAMATRCCWPPESCRGQHVELVEQADPIQQRDGPRLGRRAVRPRTWIGASVTFWSTVRCGNKLNAWKTMPTRRRIAAGRLAVRSDGWRQQQSRRDDRPSWNGSRPLRQRRKVLLPPPEGPMIAATSPRCTSGRCRGARRWNHAT